MGHLDVVVITLISRVYMCQTCQPAGFFIFPYAIIKFDLPVLINQLEYILK
jgi:hypothetical protein